MNIQNQIKKSSTPESLANGRRLKCIEVVWCLDVAFTMKNQKGVQFGFAGSVPAKVKVNLNKFHHCVESLHRNLTDKMKLICNKFQSQIIRNNSIIIIIIFIFYNRFICRRISK